MDLPSRLDIYSLGRSYVLDHAKRIDPTKVDVLGSDVNLFVGSQSVVAFQLVKQLAYRTAALLLDSATGEDLDRLAWDRFKLLRKGASPALGTERFFRLTATAGAGTLPIGTVVKSKTGIEYTAVTVVPFAI